MEYFPKLEQLDLLTTLEEKRQWNEFFGLRKKLLPTQNSILSENILQERR